MVKLYGVDGSQPCRSVKWLMLIKDLPFEQINSVPGANKNGGTRSPEFKKMSPLGEVPVLEDDGFFLAESCAIMTYLCNKYGWDDLYPKDLKKRGEVDQWLHWHHKNTRTFTIALFAPLFRPDLKFSEEFLNGQKASLKKVCQTLEEVLEGKKYITGENLTLADICFYGDMGQLGSDYLKLYEFEKFPNVHRWMETMKQVPKYKEAHEVMPMLMRIVKKQKANM